MGRLVWVGWCGLVGVGWLVWVGWCAGMAGGQLPEHWHKRCPSICKHGVSAADTNPAAAATARAATAVLRTRQVTMSVSVSQEYN